MHMYTYIIHIYLYIYIYIYVMGRDVLLFHFCALKSYKASHALCYYIINHMCVVIYTYNYLTN